MDCLTDLGDGLACKKTCVEEVMNINNLIKHSQKVKSTTQGSWNSAGILYTVLGLLFAIAPILILKKIDPILISLGSVFLIYGIYTLTRGRIFTRNQDEF